MTFATDVSDRATLASTLERLVASVCEGLDASGRRGRTVTLKVRLRPFRTHTRSRTLAEPTADPGTVGRVARELLEGFEADAPVRLLGVGVAGLERDGAPDPARERPDDSARTGPAQLALG